MIATARLAYGNARVRARKARLLSSSVLLALAAADRPDLTIDGWRDLDPEADAAALTALVYARLTGDYDTLIRAFPAAADALQALAALHDVENVKLAWRAVTRGMDADRWSPLWRPLGAVERVSRTACAAALSLEQLASALRRTPFGEIAAQILRAHGDDLAAAEIALDRWASQRLAASMDTLPTREPLAADLVSSVVCERDAALADRSSRVLGFNGDAALRMTRLLKGLLGPFAADAIAKWTRGGGAPVHLPSRLSFDRRAVASFDDLRQAIAANRRTLCRRAFLTTPFGVAPALALILFREDEARALISLAELRARRASTAERAPLLAPGG